MTRSVAALVTTYAPTRCGIARYSAALADSLLLWGRETDIFRIVQSGEAASQDLRVVMEFNPASAVSIEAAQRALSRYPVVMVQHEFGIFGPDDGRAVIDLLEGVKVPVMVVLHTVPLRPSDSQRKILHSLAESASVLVVPSHAARVGLEDVYGITADQAVVLPHGSTWEPAEQSSGDRHRLITWGLLGPGKGIERAIAAVGELHDLRPPISYRIVGQTHPNVLKRQGFAYRSQLEGLVRRQGLEHRILLDDGYKPETDLQKIVAAADLVVIPYDNNEQACSGVLTDALAAGRPVVATAFPHAVELLGSGAGLLVSHDDPAEMGKAIRTLLSDDIAYRRAVTQARYQARRLAWPEVARRFEELLGRLSASLAVG
ncbi:MAG TPA: glycosyltransferase [Acidimicrobiia bacterium]|nr:glycosyltransferase [Acidimicrobiia bacterium]